MLLVLWDVDGTLVRTRGARISVNAFLRALAQVADLTADLAYPTDAGGKTDEQLALEVLLAAAFDEPAARALLPGFGSAYLKTLEAEVEQLRADLRVLPGVPEALQALQDAGVQQALLTGNLEPIARLKLTCVDLEGYFAFDVGAYGSDHADRTRLVPVARERAAAVLGSAPEQVVVIGDTPRDIACARAGGARAIAVATGNYSPDDLRQHAPDVLLEDLRDTQAVLRAISGTVDLQPAPIV